MTGEEGCVFGRAATKVSFCDGELCCLACTHGEVFWPVPTDKDFGELLCLLVWLAALTGGHSSSVSRVCAGGTVHSAYVNSPVWAEDTLWGEGEF